MSEQQNIIIPDQEPLPIDRAIAALRKEILAYTTSTGSTTPGLYTFRQSLHSSEPLLWLDSQEIFPRVYWMNREKNFTIAGIGAADSISYNEVVPNGESFQLLVRNLLLKDPSVRYVGGFRFNNMEIQDGTWDKFPSFMFVLPLIQITVENECCNISCHLWIETSSEFKKKTGELLAALDALRPETAATQEVLPEIRQITCMPDRNLWTEQCRKALGLFESGTMDKIMLARRTVLEFSRSFSPMLYLVRYPYPQNSTYRFYLEPEKNRAFISFTPERLYSRNGYVMHTEALAGTCMKETINGGDILASEMLLNSEKDIREHCFVKDTIYRELQPVSDTVEMEANLRVLQLNRLAHLYTRCTARLKPECCSDSIILSLLHPTPAVGGVPKEDAMQHIMDLEPFCRGWYAAPVGWISRDSAEFSVGIRSALVNEKTTSLYSGAGLVRGSDPDMEWEEVEQKIGDIMAIMGHHA